MKKRFRPTPKQREAFGVAKCILGEYGYRLFPLLPLYRYHRDEVMAVLGSDPAKVCRLVFRSKGKVEFRHALQLSLYGLIPKKLEEALGERLVLQEDRDMGRWQDFIADECREEVKLFLAEFIKRPRRA